MIPVGADELEPVPEIDFLTWVPAKFMAYFETSTYTVLPPLTLSRLAEERTDAVRRRPLIFDDRSKLENEKVLTAISYMTI
jgi:hypothetical protein